MRLLSVENRWDILYRDYPEIYDEFASVPYKPKKIDVLHKRFNLNNKIVADIGSGSGLSSIKLAKYAKKVIGVEPEQSMIEIAQKNTFEQGVDNIVYVKGRAEQIPLDDNSVDFVVAITAVMYPPEEVIPKFINEARRVTKPGGTIISIDVAPGWYGGELSHIIDDQGGEGSKRNQLFIDEAGFSHFDLIQTSYYGSLEKIIRTYGFIFGKKVIAYIQQNNVTSIKWKFRVYYEKQD